MNELEKMYRLSECAALSGHRESTWRKWILLRRVSYRKIGASVRIPESELRRFLNQNTIPSRPEASR